MPTETDLSGSNITTKKIYWYTDTSNVHFFVESSNNFFISFTSPSFYPQLKSQGKAWNLLLLLIGVHCKQRLNSHYKARHYKKKKT